MEISGYSYTFDWLLLAGEIDTSAKIRFHRELGVRAHEIAEYYLDDGEIERVGATLDETGTAVSCYDIKIDFMASRNR